MSSCRADRSVAFLIPQILIVNGVCQGKFHSCLFMPCFPIFHQQFASGSTLVIPWHLLPANCQLEMFMEPLIYRFGAGATESLGPHQFLADTITLFHSGRGNDFGDQLSWGPFVHGDQISWDCLFLGTNCLGDHLTMGTKWVGTVCSWGPIVGDQMSGDWMCSGPNEKQPFGGKFEFGL